MQGKPNVLVRLRSKIDVRGPDDCWPWLDSTRDGYGRFRLRGKKVQAHRLAYVLLVGPVPDGLLLDHTCHNTDETCNLGSECPHRRCCNPAHLEPVTHRMNTLRGHSVTARHAVKTHCPQGHPYSGENLIIYRGRRYCRVCQDAHKRQHRMRKAAGDDG